MNYFHGVDGVIVVDPRKENVLSLIQRCELLITDYSSVHFDALYLEKPVVFYQWDFSPYTKKHHGSIMSSYTGYGYNVGHAEDVVRCLHRYFDGEDLCMKPFQFSYRDKNNCQRIYEAVAKA